MLSEQLPIIATVLIPEKDFPWLIKKDDRGNPGRYYDEDNGPLLDSKGMKKSFGLNREMSHVVFTFYDESDMDKILLFKLKWGSR